MTIEHTSAFNVRNFNAAGNGREKDTAAIQKAIDDCAVSGGGVGCCPPGLVREIMHGLDCKGVL